MERVQQCGDGKYRWIYKMSTLKNPSMMIRMGKILGVTLLVVYIVAQLASLTGEGEKPVLYTVKMLMPAVGIILAVYVVPLQYDNPCIVVTLQKVLQEIPLHQH